MSRWRLKPALFGLLFVRLAGGMLIALGVIGFLDSFAHFAVQGRVHARARLPDVPLSCDRTVSLCPKSDICSGGDHDLGQALILGNVPLLEYGGLVWLLLHAFALVYEEPTLSARFGSEYKLYCNEVPRGSKVHGMERPEVCEALRRASFLLFGDCRRPVNRRE